MSAEQPGEAGEANGQNGGAVDDEHAVDQVLGDAEAEDREGGREPDDRQDDDPLLPERAERILDVEWRQAQEELEQVDDQDGGRDHNERAGPPGAEAGEEAPEGAERLVGPDVDRTLTGEHEAELASDDGAGDEE